MVTVTAVAAADSSASGAAQLTVNAAPGSGGGGGELDWLLLGGVAVALAVRRTRPPCAVRGLKI